MYDGTWGGGPVPMEIVDFEMCKAFGISWREWKEETPLYVQRVWSDLLSTKRRAEASAAEAAQRRAQRQQEG